MEVNNSKYLKFIQQGLEVAKAIPKYFSKYSNKIFTNQQHLVLVVLKQKLKTTWRNLLEILKISVIPEQLNLRRIPHFTTLIKFSKRISPLLVNKLLAYSTRLSKPQNLGLGVDATGLELDNGSKHYELIRGKDCEKRDVIQITACGLMDSLIVSSARVERHKTVRNNNFLAVVQESAQLGQIDFVCADKGYDSNKNHEYLIRELKTKSCIKIREKSVSKRAGRSTIRKRVLRTFDDKTYHQRSKIETIFSMIKRNYGSAIKSKSKETQIQEGYHKLLTHNIERLCEILSQIISQGFHQS